MTLDVGCGRNPRGDVNVDVSSSLADVLCDAQALPFKTGSFDRVLSYHCIEHCPDPAKMLGEMLRVGRKVKFWTDDVHWPGRYLHYVFKRGQCVGTEHCMAWTRRYMENWLRLLRVERWSVRNVLLPSSPAFGFLRKLMWLFVAWPLSLMGIKPTIEVEICRDSGY